MPTTTTRLSRPNTSVNTYIACFWGIGLTIIVYFYLYLPRLLGDVMGMTDLAAALTGKIFLPENSYLWQLFCERGPTQHLCMVSLFTIAATLIAKYRIIRDQKGALEEDPLPENVNVMDSGTMTGLRLQLRQNPRINSSLLFSRLDYLISMWLSTEDHERVSRTNTDEGDIDAANAEASYSISKVLIWVMPILGFIGTVIGISQAIQGFSGILTTGQVDTKTLVEAITGVTQSLSVAFDTTLVGLVFTVIAMFPLTVIQYREDAFLGNVDAYVDDKFMSRLMGGGESIVPAIRDMTKAIDEGFKRLPNPDKYEEVFNRAITGASKTVADQFGTLARDYESKLGGVSNQIAANMEKTVAAFGSETRKYNEQAAAQQQQFLAARAESEAREQARVETLRSEVQKLIQGAAAAQQQAIGLFEAASNKQSSRIEAAAQSIGQALQQFTAGIAKNLSETYAHYVSAREELEKREISRNAQLAGEVQKVMEHTSNTQRQVAGLFETVAEKHTARVEAATQAQAGQFQQLMAGISGELKKTQDQLAGEFRKLGAEISGAQRLLGEQFNAAAQTHASSMQAAAGALAEKIARIEQVGLEIDKLLRVGLAVEGAIREISASEEFRNTLEGLRTHLANSDEQYRKLAKPRVLRVHEEMPPE